MKTLKTNNTLLIGGALGILAVFLVMLSFVAPASGDSGSDYRIAEYREDIYEAQINAADAHESLAKSKEVVKAAVEAERKAQAIVDAYSETATAARKAICALDKESCNRENLDPLDTQIQLDQFFITARQ